MNNPTNENVNVNEVSGYTSSPTADLIQNSREGSGDFSPEQLKNLAKWAVEDGNLSQEEANRMLQNDGIQIQVETQTPVNPIDKDFPPAKPVEFAIPPLTNDGEYSKELQQLDSQVRGWLSDARFTKEMGSYVAEEFDRVAYQHQKMSESDKLLWARDQEKMLQGMWGNQANENILLAQTLIQELETKSPGLIEILESSGAGNSAMIIAQVFHQAQRLKLRQGK